MDTGFLPALVIDRDYEYDVRDLRVLAELLLVEDIHQLRCHLSYFSLIYGYTCLLSSFDPGGTP